MRRRGAESRAPTVCDLARGPGVCRLRALTLSLVAKNDLRQVARPRNPLRSSRPAGSDSRAFSRPPTGEAVADLDLHRQQG
jgi:hypothetical protein